MNHPPDLTLLSSLLSTRVVKKKILQTRMNFSRQPSHVVEMVSPSSSIACDTTYGNGFGVRYRFCSVRWQMMRTTVAVILHIPIMAMGSI